MSRRRLGRLMAGLRPSSVAATPIPAIDGVRALAVLTVMLFHAWYKGPAVGESPQEITSSPLWSGHTAVQLFFALSGFLLFLPYARWLLGLRPEPSALRFYRRRALRVGPAFWYSLCILALAGPLTLSRLGLAASHVLFVFNFIPGASSQFNDVYWTMAVEVQFYALLPLIARAVALAARRFGLPAALASLAAAGLLVTAASAWISHRYSPLGVVWYGLAGQYSVTLWMSAFTSGMIAGIAYVVLARPTVHPRVSRAAGIATLVTLLICAVLIAVPSLRHLPLLMGNDGLAFAWASGVLILGVAIGPRWLQRPLEWRPVRFVGAISYSVYIWHMVVFAQITPHLAGLRGATDRVIAGFALEVVLCIPVGFLSYHLTERPFLHSGRGQAGAEVRARAVETQQTARLHQTERFTSVGPVTQTRIRTPLDASREATATHMS